MTGKLAGYEMIIAILAIICELPARWPQGGRELAATLLPVCEQMAVAMTPRSRGSGEAARSYGREHAP